MTTRSEVPPSGEASSLLGELNNSLVYSLKAFEASGLKASGVEADSAMTQAAKENLEKLANQNMLGGMLAQAQQLADPEVRNQVVRMIEGAMAGEGNVTTAVEFASAAINNAITQGTIRLIVDEGQDVDSARLRQFLAAQERSLLNLNAEAQGLRDGLLDYVSDETRSRSEAAQAELDAASAAMESAETDEERDAARGRVVAATAESIAIDRQIEKEVTQNPDAPEQVQSRSRGLGRNADSREQQLENTVAAQLMANNPDWSEEQARTQARSRLNVASGNREFQNDVSDETVEIEGLATAMVQGQQPAPQAGGESVAPTINPLLANVSFTTPVIAESEDVTLADVSEPAITEETVDTEQQRAASSTKGMF